MNRDAEKARDNHAASVRRYRERVMREVLAGERPYNSIPRVNRARKARRVQADEVYGSYYRWVRDESGEPCALAMGTGGHRCGSREGRTRLEAHHIKTVGSGGKDAANTIRVCPAAHDEIHDHGRTHVRNTHGIDLIGVALDTYARHDREESAA
jgi:hypothetical protein